MTRSRALIVTSLLGLASVRCAAEGVAIPPDDDAGLYSGGAFTGLGGASSGGAPMGAGGVFVGAGGSLIASGGAGSGGVPSGPGGAAPAAGGTGAGGAEPGAGGAVQGAGGAVQGAGGAGAGGAIQGAGGSGAGGAGAGGAGAGGAGAGGAGAGGAGAGGAGAGGAGAGGSGAGGAGAGGAGAGGSGAGGAGAGGGGAGGSGAGGAPPCNGSVAGVDPIGNDNRAPCFLDLSPPPGAALPVTGTALNPAPPSGWQWHPISGAVCRDGTPTGIFVRRGTSRQLLFYLEGGGACSNVPFCRFNPKSANEVLAGDGSTVLGSAGGAIGGRQQPGAYSGNVPAGVFDPANSANPFRDWNMVYVPYCTGDVHFGTRANATVPGTPGADPRDLTQHQFLGYRNMERIVARVVPTFPDMTRVVLTGSSAGAFGAELNFSMVQDSFGSTPVTVIGDSGVPFADAHMPACMQNNWRQNWGLAFPADCTECQQPGGGGLLGMADFLLRKHPNAKIAVISTIEDEVIRLFFSVGLVNCTNYATSDPVFITVAQLDPNVYMVGSTYRNGLLGVRTQYQATNRLATYYVPGQAPHQHIFRPSFFTTTVGGTTMLKFVNDFLGGTVTHIGP